MSKSILNRNVAKNSIKLSVLYAKKILFLVMAQ